MTKKSNLANVMKLHSKLDLVTKQVYLYICMYVCSLRFIHEGISIIIHDANA